MSDRLPSWRPGPTREAILAFLDRSGDVPDDERVAYVDNEHAGMRRDWETVFATA